ncbi:MAG: hypothetical protein R3D51_10465 [Hyphomicrobiaceae bacterium]
MITVYNAMLVLLGTLLAALAMLFLMPAYRRRIERFTTERIKRALPLTEAEIRADKDRLRAEYATEVHKLEMKLEEAGLTGARQSVEINRRDARISELENLLQSQKTNVEEHQNARRVLEQTILDRLPKVEARLGEARRMLLQRDGEIASLTQTGARQSEALEQASQINTQLTQETQRLRSALNTRAARNREAIGDPRFDGEVALRTEIETLRAKSEDQARLIEKLQAADATSQDGDQKATQEAEAARLRSQLAKVEAELEALKADSGGTERMASLEDENREQLSEIARLMASLRTYEDDAKDRHEPDALAAKAEIGALQAQVEEQKHTIEALRAEVAAGTERLARQAQHFREEMHRLSVQSSEGEGAAGKGSAETPRRSLADRIAQPRVPGRLAEASVEVVRPAASNGNAEAAREQRSAGYLKAVNGNADAAPAPSEKAAPAPRRARLLERISNLDKSG